VKSHGYSDYLEHKTGWKKEMNTVFIFDEAQLTYWDTNLWGEFFAKMMDYKNLCAIALTGYGSPSSRKSERQRVTLKAVSHDDGLPPVGLLLSREEMNLLFSPEHGDSSFFDALFILTGRTCGSDP